MKKILFIIIAVALSSCATQKRAPKVTREQTMRKNQSYCVTDKSERKYHRHLHKLVEMD